MSNGRKVKVELTQAEAHETAALMAGRDYDAAAVERVRLKIQHQLNAVRGKVSGGVV